MAHIQFVLIWGTLVLVLATFGIALKRALVVTIAVKASQDSQPSIERSGLTEKKKSVNFVAILFMLLPVLVLIILRPSDALDFVFHGSAGITLICAAILSVFVAINRYQKKRVENPGPPSTKWVLTTFAAGFAATFSVWFAWQYSDYRNTLEIQQHGKRAVADVVKIYSSGCGKSGCNTAVEYRYTPQAKTASVTGYGTLATRSNGQDPDLIFAERFGRVPIVYSLNHPSHSSLNFKNRVFKEDAGSTLHFMTIIGCMIATIGALAAMLLAPPTSLGPQGFNSKRRRNLVLSLEE